MCIQESCKCFKAHVGCGGHCLCVGCENVHGKRGDYNFDHKKIDSDEFSVPRMPTKRKNHAHKGCKCQNTNCLKLYCICFAAEHHCNEACSCKECFNQLDYKEKVDKAREEAQERNPLAFSTKEGREKHIIGCKCRVSKCSRLLCKCYRTQVGCRSECRCVGICENIHGKRGDNFDMMMGTSIMESEYMNQFIPQNMDIPCIQFQSSNHDMMIGTPQDINGNDPSSVGSLSYTDMVSLNQFEVMNQFTPEDIDARDLSSMMNTGSSNCEKMIGTSTRDWDMVPMDQLDLFMNPFTTPQDFISRHDDRRK
ncbi:unnamed protein product [Lactuca saligna]|uniref:CRC domain-containing protein n=1 Tax=Lactuca saligna TaxID=75948 RepID=A0AA35ZBA0_LACSI|nr:unnamed protein product [Lactuca saligna]